MPAGRPSKYNETLLEQARKLSLLGLTDEQMADVCDVSLSAWYKWKNEHPEFMEAIKDGKAEADAQVVKSLYRRAIGYTTRKTQIVTYQGAITDRAEYDEEVNPDTTACIFWLKNRQPELWRDRHQLEHSGKIDVPQINIITQPES